MEKINPGIYLVLNPAIKKEYLLEKLKQAIEGGITILQIWNNWPKDYGLPEKKAVIDSVTSITAGYNIPVLINEEWELLHHPELDGVHFDEIPENYDSIKSELRRSFIAGITCENNLDVVRWAEENDLDYISFCSMFPSPSVQSCEIVNFDTVKKARQITKKPIFLSGGITHENLKNLHDLDFDGIAVISGILNAEAPKIAASKYQKALIELK